MNPDLAIKDLKRQAGETFWTTEEGIYSERQTRTN